ncbi:phospholipase [Pseudomonas sp. 148P]|uniref:Phospholipase n=1 Tax=Pseudomonas ulcerans TaxID=3115852 RepID=A0ABU7I0S1_9PSED|nr:MULTISPECIES: phospholipase [unclassified Pseudomonas]MEE1926018.1 phospholipase [Pseudomonas sp. 147P]MEE1937263.1 phospholipase [Pseudomonas sp. 148P]
MTRPEIVVPIALQHTQEATCVSPWFVQNTLYHPETATYRPLVNGEETFAVVHRAIADAKRSVDIICWGFQPSMFLIRDGKAPSIGELLRKKAAEGVKVRLLTWEAPLNTAGIAGEANLPQRRALGLWDEEMQSTTEEQSKADREWFKRFGIDDSEAARRTEDRIPLLVSRGFNFSERRNISRALKEDGLDPNLAGKTRLTMALAPSHHQKSVLVDYELPEEAIGFVLGHNMLDEYWDTDKHSAKNRFGDSRPAPDRGPRGVLPRQDISCQLTGPILEHLHANFAEAWLKETGENLLEVRPAKELGQRLKCGPDTRQMVQVLRTQPQTGIRDIQSLYLQAVNNATQFIYIENQYFRWPPLAEAIKAAAANQTRQGRDPGVQEALHLFVITNAGADSVAAGSANTQRMLESLGRADTIPHVTKLSRIREVKRAAPPKPRPDPRDHRGKRELEQWEKDLDRQIQEIEDSTIYPEEIPGLKVHVCSLVAPDSFEGSAWTPVYVHSKLMIVDDVFTTQGSANINHRSMIGDSELNIAHDWMSVTQELRRRLWDLHTGKKGAQDDPAEAFKIWKRIIDENKDLQEARKSPKAPLIEFYFDKPVFKEAD